MMPNHDSLVPYLFAWNIALRRVIESILNNCANTQASTLSVFICLHMLLRKWLDINRMCQMHLYPPFHPGTHTQKYPNRCLDRHFCTLRQLARKLVQTFALSLEIYIYLSSFFVSVPSLNFLWYIYIQFYIQNIYNAIAIQIVR